MAKRKAPEKRQMPADKTQAMNLIPPELSMLEPLPPIGEEPTQALPLQHAEREDASEALGIVVGPDATVAIKAGQPAPDETGSATQVMPVAADLGSSTEILPTADPFKTAQITVPVPPPPPVFDKTQISPPRLPRPVLAPEFPTRTPRPGMPGWAWAGLAALVLLGGLGGVALLRPDLLGLQQGAQHTEGESTPTAAEPASGPSESVLPEQAAQEIPPALRTYYDRALKGDSAAMYTLGVMYANGLNVAKNPEEGLRWKRKAADAGSKAAQKELKQLGIQK